MNFLVSLFIGSITSIMILLNGTLSNALWNFTASILIHVVGLCTIILVLFIRKQQITRSTITPCYNESNISLFKGIPWYLYSAGAIGVFTVLFNNLSFDQLGVSLTLALGLLGQTIISILIDHFGLFGLKKIKFNHKKYIGLFLISVGILIMTIY